MPSPFISCSAICKRCVLALPFLPEGQISAPRSVGSPQHVLPHAPGPWSPPSLLQYTVLSSKNNETRKFFKKFSYTPIYPYKQCKKYKQRAQGNSLRPILLCTRSISDLHPNRNGGVRPSDCSLAMVAMNSGTVGGRSAGNSSCQFHCACRLPGCHALSQDARISLRTIQ